MPQTHKSKSSLKRRNNKTKKNTSTKSSSNLKVIRNIIGNLIHMKHAIKLFHWTTNYYSIHKTTDNFLQVLDPLLDKYVEVFLGSVKHGEQKNASVEKQLKKELKKLNIKVLENKKDLSNILDKMIKELNNHEKYNKNVELLAIRDELVAEIQKLKYLLNF